MDADGSARTVQVLGGLTAAYGLMELAAPGVLARQTGLPRRGAVGSLTKLLSVALGVRDTVSGLAMLVAEPGPGRDAAVIARCVFDAGDAVAFGLLLPVRASTRRKAFALGAGWSAVCGVAGLSAHRASAAPVVPTG